MANLSSLINNGKLRITSLLETPLYLSTDTLYDARIGKTIVFLPHTATIANNKTEEKYVTAKQVVDYLNSL